MNLDKDQADRRPKREMVTRITAKEQRTSKSASSLTGGGVYSSNREGSNSVSALEKEAFSVRAFLEDLINGRDDHPY